MTPTAKIKTRNIRTPANSETINISNNPNINRVTRSVTARRAGIGSRMAIATKTIVSAISRIRKTNNRNSG